MTGGNPKNPNNLSKYSFLVVVNPTNPKNPSIYSVWACTDQTSQTPGNGACENTHAPPPPPRRGSATQCNESHAKARPSTRAHTHTRTSPTLQTLRLECLSSAVQHNGNTRGVQMCVIVSKPSDPTQGGQSCGSVSKSPSDPTQGGRICVTVSKILQTQLREAKIV